MGKNQFRVGAQKNTDLGPNGDLTHSMNLAYIYSYFI
jgi:hypothetical protein